MKKLKSQNNIGYLYLLPAVILMGVFIIYSMILNVQISMTDWSGLSEKHFIAFANYVKLFRDKAFWDSLGVQLIWMLLSTVFHALGGLILSIIVEYFIHRKLQAVFRTLFFMPMMMSLVAVGILWTLIYNPLIGVINEILQVLGILSGNQTLDLLGDRSTALLAAFIPALWQWSGFGMVVFSAALQGMSRELLEAASLDGCSKWQQIRYIILPLLRPHFCGRFPEEDFMIYDAVHQAVLLHEGHSTRLLELAAPLELPPPSAREQQFQALWTQFYKTLEIKARHNEKGRMTHCPKRFWADMVELHGEL